MGKQHASRKEQNTTAATNAATLCAAATAKKMYTQHEENLE